MKKKYLLLLSLPLLLAGCGGEAPSSLLPSSEEPPVSSDPASSEPSSPSSSPSSSEERSFHYARYYLDKEATSPYKTVVVSVGKTLPDIPNPVKEGYCFSHWSEGDSTTAFTGFGGTLEEDIDLYGNWDLYSEMSDLEKIDRLFEWLSDLEGKVISTYGETIGTQTEYLTSGLTYSVGNKAQYNRYKDITVMKAYDYEAEEMNEASLYGETQFFYDEEYFYRINQSYSSEFSSSKRTASYDPSQEESFLNIGYTNLNLSSLRSLRNALSSGASTSSYQYDLGIDGEGNSFPSAFDLTSFDVTSGSFSFSYMYYTVVEDQSYGTYETTIYVSSSISFIGGELARSRTTSETYVAWGGDLLYSEVYQDDFDYTRGEEYPSYEGTRFDPADYTEAS